MKIVDKFLNKLKERITIPYDVKFKRTYAGKHQLSHGSFSGYFYSEYTDSKFIIGIYSPLSILIKCPNLIIVHPEFPLDKYIECNCENNKCKGLYK